MRGWNCAVCNQDFDSVFKKSSTLSKNQQKLWKILCDYFINQPVEYGQRHNIIHGIPNPTRQSNKKIFVHSDLDLNSQGSQYSFTPFCPECQEHIEELNRLDNLLSEIRQKIKAVSAHISATLVQSFDPFSSSSSSFTIEDDDHGQAPKNRSKFNEKDLNFIHQVNTIIKETRRTIYKNYQPIVLLRSGNDDDKITRNESHNVFELDGNTCLPQPPSTSSETSSSPCIVDPQPDISSSNNNDGSSSSTGPIESIHSDTISDQMSMQHENEVRETGFVLNYSNDENDNEDYGEQDYHYDDEEGSRGDEYTQQYYMEKEDSRNNVITHHYSSLSPESEDCVPVVNVDDDAGADYDCDSNDLIIDEAPNDEDNQQYNNIPISLNANTQLSSIGFTQVNETTEGVQPIETSKHLIMSVEEIQTLTLAEILNRLSGYHITKEQIAMIKKIRRKERNRISAMQSRQRQFQKVVQLQQELQKFKGKDTSQITRTRLRNYLKKRVVPKVPVQLQSSSTAFKDCILIDDGSTKESGLNTSENYTDSNKTQLPNCTKNPETCRIIQNENGIQVVHLNTNSGGLYMTMKDLQNSPLNDIFRRFASFNLSEDQKSLIRTLRRKEQNRICAKNSRARFRSQVHQLQNEVEMYRERKSELIEERKQLRREQEKLNGDYEVLQQAVVQGLLQKCGVDSNTNYMDYSLKQLDHGEFALELKQNQRSFTSHYTFNPTGAIDLRICETTCEDDAVEMVPLIPFNMGEDPRSSNSSGARQENWDEFLDYKDGKMLLPSIGNLYWRTEDMQSGICKICGVSVPTTGANTKGLHIHAERHTIKAKKRQTRRLYGEETVAAESNLQNTTYTTAFKMEYD